MTDKIETPQDFYDTNRTRFNAESYAFDIKSLHDTKCDHTKVKRVSPQEVHCTMCSMGWYDHGKFIIDNNQIVNILK